MRIWFGLEVVCKVHGMVNSELDFVDGEIGPAKEVKRSEFYTITIPVCVSHSAMDERDEPITYDMCVRIPILAHDEPFLEIVSRAKKQLRKDALAVADALNDYI